MIASRFSKQLTSSFVKPFAARTFSNSTASGLAAIFSIPNSFSSKNFEKGNQQGIFGVEKFEILSSNENNYRIQLEFDSPSVFDNVKRVLLFNNYTFTKTKLDPMNPPNTTIVIPLSFISDTTGLTEEVKKLVADYPLAYDYCVYNDFQKFLELGFNSVEDTTNALAKLKGLEFNNVLIQPDYLKEQSAGSSNTLFVDNESGTSLEEMYQLAKNFGPLVSLRRLDKGRSCFFITYLNRSDMMQALQSIGADRQANIAYRKPNSSRNSSRNSRSNA
ncbi:uncharacterized protein ASCRUDRAFT_80372 [Ascoidea rubescens DSM 1968]|uniref:RRM domain-containing protein n=1 Tax=Ascoidea rubescens DSM 1968 TaxID=1344418 RepID=A0A1D2VKB2_9ASCO|nr:hypothetical protein ASCRUDRAFT_80372 [Ascoidea rubescens DSM 1968]ODV62051.1 hypothetical protein ASCRUDRAFT_80372 [Ascoidea rubescens DSM 1968]